jgi:hypothetical protein
MTGQFRAWDKTKKAWYYEELYLSQMGDVMRQAYSYGEEMLRFCNAEPEFCIGAKDIHNREIFQGDFVKVNDKYIYEVKWMGYGFWYRSVDEDEENDLYVFDASVYKLEIVGNVHEGIEATG